MADTTIDDVSLDLGYLEPLEIPEGFRSRFDTVLDGILNTGFRCTDDLGDAVNMIAHLPYPATVEGRGSSAGRVQGRNRLAVADLAPRSDALPFSELTIANPMRFVQWRTGLATADLPTGADTLDLGLVILLHGSFLLWLHIRSRLGPDWMKIG
jgi:hypothetical protein